MKVVQAEARMHFRGTHLDVRIAPAGAEDDQQQCCGAPPDGYRKTKDARCLPIGHDPRLVTPRNTHATGVMPGALCEPTWQ